MNRWERLATHEAHKVVEVIRALVSQGLTIFIIEHNMPFVMSVSQRVIALEQGRRLPTVPLKRSRKNEDVILAYLGKDEDA